MVGEPASRRQPCPQASSAPNIRTWPTSGDSRDPASTAHGPDEFLHLPTGKRLTAVLAAC